MQPELPVPPTNTQHPRAVNGRAQDVRNKTGYYSPLDAPHADHLLGY